MGENGVFRRISRVDTHLSGHFRRQPMVAGNGIGQSHAPTPFRVFKHAMDIPVPKWHRFVMQRVVKSPRQRITARVSPSVRDTLEQAAELLGATVNQFVVQTAYVEAQRVIERESVIRLSQQDAHKVLALLDHPSVRNDSGCRGNPFSLA